MSNCDLSVILVMPKAFRAIRRTLQYFQAQTIRPRLQLLIVAASEDLVDRSDPLLQGFADVQVIAVGPITSSAVARTAAVAQAAAPIIAFAEDHCFPEPDWAAAILHAHQGPWAAVGPAIGNANPDTMMSWVQLYFSYGRWVEPVRGGEIDDLPGHNSSYKRAILQGYGERLRALLIREIMLHWDLRARGYILCLEPRARVKHVNVSRFTSGLKDKLVGGRIFAAARAQAEAWPAPRRLLYVLATPYLGLKRLAQIVGYVRQTGRGHMLVRMLPVLLCTWAASTVGEATGYLLGLGKAELQSEDFEFDRWKHITAADQRLLGVEPGDSGA